MNSKRATPVEPWIRIVELGERLMGTFQLMDQRQLILDEACALMDAKVELWINESLYHLPGREQLSVFPPAPADALMRQAWSAGTGLHLRPDGRTAVVVLEGQQMVFGVLKVTRNSPIGFRRSELQLLRGLAGHVSLALVTSRRLAVEQWRLEQLRLVRQVNSQIANVLDMNELSRRVCRLIRDTFHYYYVGIFTLEEGQKRLDFRSSSGASARRSRRKKSVPFDVELGQGLVGTVARTGEEILSPDVHSEPRFRFLNILPETRSEIALPLKIEERVLGVLDVQSDALEAFHPNDLLVLRALADTIAVAINNARLYSDVQARVEQLQIIAEVSKELSSVLELGQLLSQVARLIHDRLKYPHVYLYSVHPVRRQIIYEAGSGARAQTQKGTEINLDKPEGMISWVARSAQSILANDVAKEPRYIPSPYPPQDTRSELTLPLVYNNQVVGVLDLQASTVNAFQEQDLFILKALADSIAVALHNADLFQTERWRRQVAESLREVAGLLSAETSVDDVLDRVLRELVLSLPSDVSAVWLLDGETLYSAHIHGSDITEVEATMSRWPESSTYLMDLLHAEEPVVRQPNDSMDPTAITLGFSADYSLIGVTLRAGGRVLGLITLSHHAAGRYGHEAQAIITSFASYAAVAIENARLFDSAQEQAYASAALLQVAQAVAKSKDLGESIATVVRITPLLVGVKACAIYLWEGSSYRPLQGFGFSEPAQTALGGRSLTTGDFPLLDAVRATGQNVVGVMPEGLEAWLDPELARDEQETVYALQTGDHLLIGFPLIIKGDFYGVLLAEELAEARRFRPKRIEILNGIAQQLALSIQNEHLQQVMVARERLDHEIQLARQIQRTFLPERLPEFPHWELAAVWRTARQVGGDFYDVIELPGGRLGLFIADVSDKGIPAALFMAMTRTLVRAQVFDSSSPAEVLRRVNTLMIPDNQQAMFVTAVYAVLTLETGELTYANAGHNPPLWIASKGGAIEALSRTSAALGIIEGMPVEERRITLNQGEMLLLYTDGLTEAFSPQEELFGEERLRSVTDAARGQSARGLLDNLEKAVDDFMGSTPAADDMTMLTVRHLPD
jgi:serine phosphatase RsbU (regulator of sigma subunit)/putative methionine-R-sulfoxide reductase with GAF domain